MLKHNDQQFELKISIFKYIFLIENNPEGFG